jgi:hypothetical protein
MFGLKPSQFHGEQHPDFSELIYLHLKNEDDGDSMSGYVHKERFEELVRLLGDEPKTTAS